MSKEFTRRVFLQRTAGTATAMAASKSVLLAAESFAAQDTGEKVRFGIIGIGMQGSGLMANMLQLPGVECVAASDLYDGRLTLAKEIARRDLPTTRKYKDLLDNKDVQCIIAAVPDHWHRQIVVDAVSAGKDIYCEKPMSHSPAEGIAMVQAQQKTGRIVQIGSQRVSSAICAKAKELLAQGIIGDLNLVEGSLGRNDPTGAWEYPVPPDLSTTTLDWDTWQGTAPHRPFDGQYFARWRCWKEYGTGVAGDLLVHLVSGMLFMLGWNEPPKRAMATGGILRWKDGRNMPDVHATLFEYGATPIPVYMRLNLGCETPEVYRFQGSKGLLEVTENSVSYSPQSGIDEYPSYYAVSFPRAMHDTYLKQWYADHPVNLAKEQVHESMTFRGPSYDDVKPHLWNFVQSVKSRKPVVEDAVFGHHAALACHMANESYFRKAPVTWDEASGQIKTA